jgi:aminoglycoside phosphotransferase (APT) family kinase protein
MLGSLLFLVNKLDEMSRLFFSYLMADLISGQDTFLVVVGQVAYIIGHVAFWRLYAARAERQFHIERALLHILEAHPVIPAPRIVAAGERASGPPYLLLAGIPGDTAENVWNELERSQQLALARDFGAITAAIHRLPQEELAAIEQQFGGRSEHTRAWKKQRLSEIETAESFSVKQRDDLLRFLHEEAPQLGDDRPQLTHYDLAHNHIYLSQDAGAWRVTGIIDWAEAMLGPPEWDIAYLWFWTFTATARRCAPVFRPFTRTAQRPSGSPGAVWLQFFSHLPCLCSGPISPHEAARPNLSCGK